MTERLSAYDRDGLRKQAEKREADKQRKLDTWDDLLAACYTALHFTANIDPWWEPSHQQTVATLRAAIAKARGHDAGGE